MNAQCRHKWWSTLKSAVFGSSSDSSLPPLIGAAGGLVCESVGKALSGALPLPYEPARVTRGALVAHSHSFAPPRCRTSQHRRSFVPLSVSLWNDLSDPVLDGVGLAGFKSRANAFLLA